MAMKIFNRFLRRAGVQQPVIRPASASESRLSVLCMRQDMASVRKRIYTDFQAAGLRVSNLSVEHASHENAKACVTISCPPEMRPELMTQARRLRDHPSILNVQWEPRQRSNALN